MDRLIDALDGLPVATLIIVILAIVGGVDIVLDGHLSPDFKDYAAIIGGSTGLLGIGRGIRKSGTPVTTTIARRS